MTSSPTNPNFEKWNWDRIRHEAVRKNLCPVCLRKMHPDIDKGKPRKPGPA